MPPGTWPGILDLRAIGASIEIANLAKRRAVLVVNGARQGGAAQEAAEAARDSYGIETSGRTPFQKPAEADGTSHLCSVADILLGAFRYCVNEPDNEEAGKAMFPTLSGQVPKDREIDAVFSKALRILGHAELAEPVRNLLHRPAPSQRTLRCSTR
jgi:hypothetical protein